MSVCKPFNWIISWSAGFKTGPVYTQSKSRSIWRQAWSKSRPVHVLDSLAPRARGQRSFACADKSCWIEAVKHSLGTRLVGLSLTCYLLVSQARLNQCQRGSLSVRTLIGSRLWDYLACSILLSVLVCFSKSFGQLSCRSGHRLVVWQACTAFIPFGLLVNHSASFQAIKQHHCAADSQHNSGNGFQNKVSFIKTCCSMCCQ